MDEIEDEEEEEDDYEDIDSNEEAYKFLASQGENVVS